MKVPSTPFDNTIVHFTKLTFSKPQQLNPFVSLVQQQLSLLRLIYIEMHKIDIYEKNVKRVKELSKVDTVPISIQEVALTYGTDINKAILDYNSFLFVTNQFGRALKAKFKADLLRFPNYYEIKFYRDKVAEHWDHYVYTTSKGLTFQKGKSSIPVVGATYRPVKRAKVAKDLENVFKQIGFQVHIPNEFAENSQVSTNPKYVQFMYDSLKKINKRLYLPHPPNENDPYYKLIALLFDFGFPAPILDMETYSIELVEYITTISKKHILASSR